MDRLSGTRYTYTKTRVAYLVPFIFLIPTLIVLLFVFLLNTRALASGEFIQSLSLGMKFLAGVLFLLGAFVARDLWKTFTRTISEEIWVTDRDIVWIGRGSKVLVKSPHQDIQEIVRIGTDPERAWIFEIRTLHGRIRFTRSLEFADELVRRIETFVANSRKMHVGA